MNLNARQRAVLIGWLPTLPKESWTESGAPYLVKPRAYRPTVRMRIGMCPERRLATFLR